jgi:hypothetical protein
MGLAQRRISEDYQTKVFPKWKKQMKEAVGFDIPLEVKWDTMQDEEYNDKDSYFEWYDQVYFRPLLEVFKSLCGDDMGRQAVKKGVKKIIIDGTDGSGAHNATFDKGVFTINHKFHTNVSQEGERVTGWTKLLESKL